MYGKLLESVLVLVIGFLLKLAFAAINFQIDEALFNTLVVAIAAYFLSLFGGAVAARYRPASFRAEE